MLQTDKRFNLPFIKVIPFTGKVKPKGDLSLLVLKKVSMQGIGRIHIYLEFKPNKQDSQPQQQVTPKESDEKPLDAIVTVKDNDMGTTIRLFEWLTHKKGKTLEEIYKSDIN